MEDSTQRFGTYSDDSMSSKLPLRERTAPDRNFPDERLSLQPSAASCDLPQFSALRIPYNRGHASDCRCPGKQAILPCLDAEKWCETWHDHCAPEFRCSTRQVAYFSNQTTQCLRGDKCPFQRDYMCAQNLTDSAADLKITSSSSSVRLTPRSTSRDENSTTRSGRGNRKS
jgi:hypothetical protein